MNEIKSFGLVICILMVLMAYLKQAIPRGKTTYLMKAIISVFILLSIIDGVRNFDLASVKALLDSGYAQDDEVWENSAALIGEGLRDEFGNYLKNEKINAEVQSVRVDVDQNGFVIEQVIVSGTEAETARNLLAGRYQIGISYIEVKNE